MHTSEFAPTSLPRIDYATINDDQAGHISEAMTLPENQDKYEVVFLPIDTPEARKAAAKEWADYTQAKGDVATSERGAVAVLSTRDESPEAFERLMEDHLNTPEFATHALMKVTLKADDSSVYDLMSSYHESKS